MKVLHRRRQFFHQLRSVASTPAALQDLHADAAVPPEVVAFLSDLSLLRGVPFHYLVPDARMLVPESIRFFHVDPNWVRAAVAGAFSVARASKTDLAFDVALWQKVCDAVGATVPPVMTGFLLRSAVVSGWPDLQVDAYPSPGADDSQRLALVRKDTLASDILLCLFSGELKQIAIHKPPEILHFGVEIEGLTATGFMKSLKSLTVKPGSDAGVQAPGVFRAGSQRVVDVAGLRTSMQDHLAGYSGPLTAAEFAMQMVEKVERVYFNVTEPAP